MDLPPEGAIEQGTVSRVEPYGAFVDLHRYRRCRGLVHISQIVNYKIEKVEDALAVNDTVWVKVLEINHEDLEDGRKRSKIRLSMKDASQDGNRTDLGKERASSDAIKDQIAQNLNSTIGMGVALDPMAKTGNLVLKFSGASQSTLINGYALVGDDEGELPSSDPVPVEVKKPMGRGRGSTLPAWMTRSEGPTGDKPEENLNQKESTKRRRKEEKKHEKEEKKRRKHERKDDRKNRRKRRRHKNSDSDYDERQRKRKLRGSSGEESSAYDSDSIGERSKNRKRDCNRDRSKRRHSSEDDGMVFQSVDEAKRLIARLEADRKAKEMS